MNSLEEDPELMLEPFVLPSALAAESIVELFLAVTPLGDNRFRVEEPVLASTVHYGDIIAAERRDDGKYHWTDTPEEADVVGFTVMTVREKDLEREAIQSLHEEIIDCGGQWEMPVDGVIHVELPAEEGPAEQWETRYNEALAEIRDQEGS